MKRVSIVFPSAFSVISSIASVSAASSSFVEHADGITDTSTTMRRLEDGGGLEFEDLSETPMHEVILTSLKVYGSVFAVLFVIFLLGRRYYPKAFLVLRDSEEDATELSRKSFGPLSWIWKVFGIGDEEIFEECGMDAVSIYCVVAVSCNPGCAFTILTLNKFLRILFRRSLGRLHSHSPLWNACCRHEHREWVLPIPYLRHGRRRNG